LEVDCKGLATYVYSCQPPDPKNGKMTVIYRTALLFLLSFLSAFSSMAGELIIDEPLERRSMAKYLHFISDFDQILYIGHIADPEFSGVWQPYYQDQRNAKLRSGAHWFKTKLVNNQDQDIEILLELEYPSIDVADMFQVSDSGDINGLYSNIGLNAAYMDRPSYHRNIINRVTIPANSSTTFIWRLESYPQFEFKITAWNPGTFAARDQHEQILYGILYGVLLVMALYNFFLFVSTRDTSYVFYVLYVLTSAYLLAAYQGHIYQYFMTDSDWPKNGIYALIYSLNALLFAKFAICFLQLRQHYRSLTRLIRFAAIFVVLGTTIVTITNSFLMIILTFMASCVLYLAVLAAGIKIRLLGVISAGHFVIAIAILVLALIVTNMMSLGMIPRTDTTESLLPVGTTVMLVFFSLALADRINQLKKENTEAIIGLEQANEEKIKASLELIKAQQTRIRLEEETNQAYLESRAKSDFLATMSHEIRTPMNGVLGMTELLKSTNLDPTQTRYLNTIEQSSHALLAIINDLLDYAKIEAGKMELDISSFNLETLLDDCISTFTLRASEKNLNFITDLSPDLDPVFKGDTTKLRQIILNLLNNAFKFTESGDILLRVSATDREAVNCVELKFEIKDSGIGLTKEEQHRLFAPFRQAASNTYGRYGGSGLGLAISKQLAELMDGKIGVISESGKGSTFWFTARLLVDKNPDPALLKEKSVQLKDKQLLLVDTDPQSSDVVARLLKTWGLNVHCVDCYVEAINAIADGFHKGHRYDIVLVDSQLGEHSGLELAEALHDEIKHKVWSFILMCSSQQLPTKTDLDNAGIDVILEKPVTFALLHDVLCQALIPGGQLVTSNFLDVDNEQISHLKILVVEDNQVNQMVIKGLLNKFHISPVIANHGLEALDKLQDQDFDLILMDCEMPEMDGYETTNQIRSREKRDGKSPVKIFALSAHARQDHQEKAQQVGMDGYLTKPITYNDLVNVLESLVG
jgi:signal transduction histidine kinase/DNA-binding response OmpR family regulator